MPRLDPARTAALQRLFASVSDDILKTLDAALALGADDCAATFAAASHARAERGARRVRDVVFAPLVALSAARPGADGAPAVRPPFNPAPDLWRLLRSTDPAAVETAVAAVRDPDRPDAAAEAADALTLLAAERLEGHADWERLRDRLERHGPDAAASLGRVLRLSPTIRAVSARTRELARGAPGAGPAALRLAFRDAEAEEPGGGLLLLAALAAQLEQPWHVLRLVSAVMDRPTDSVLMRSELAPFGEAVLIDVDSRLDALRLFDGSTGAEGGAAAAASALTCALEILELQQAMKLSRDGAWGRRIAAQRAELARLGERRLKDAADCVERALPVSASRLGGRIRGGPMLDGRFDVLSAGRALGLLAFVEATRGSASSGGFGSARAKVIADLDARLDHYVDDLLDLLHAHGLTPVEEEAARDRLDFAGQCLGLVREPKAAEQVRRRAAMA